MQDAPFGDELCALELARLLVRRAGHAEHGDAVHLGELGDLPCEVDVARGHDVRLPMRLDVRERKAFELEEPDERAGLVQEAVEVAVRREVHDPPTKALLICVACVA